MSANQLNSVYGPIYGSLYFATVMSTAFYGVACMQTFYYLVYYQSDCLRIKIFVVTAWAFNTIHEALSIAGSYKLIMTSLEDPLAPVRGNPELALTYLLTGIVAVQTQGFFVHRVYIFSEKKMVAPLTWVVLAITQVVCPALYVARVLSGVNSARDVPVGYLDSRPTLIIYTITLCFSVAAGVDVLIAIFMTSMLLRKRSDTHFPNTAHLLLQLAVFAVNTGTWTATFAVLSVVLLHVFPTNMIYATFAFPMCSIYYNTLLANLNVRACLRGVKMECEVDMDLFGSSSSRAIGHTHSNNLDESQGQPVFISSAHQRTGDTIQVKFPNGSQSTAVGEV